VLSGEICSLSVIFFINKFCSYIDVMRRLRESPSKMDKEDVEGLDNEGLQGDSLDMDRDIELEDEEEQGTDSQLSAVITQSGLPASWSPSKSSGISIVACSSIGEDIKMPFSRTQFQIWCSLSRWVSFAPGQRSAVKNWRSWI